MTAWTTDIGVPTDEERESVATLLAIIDGSESQAGEVLELLRKNGGDTERAANAFFNQGLSSSSSGGSSSTSMALVPFNRPPSARPNTPVTGAVDLTKADEMDIDDDTEMKRALQLSMEGMSGELGTETSRNQQIEAENKPDEDEIDLEAMLRTDDRPIALQPTTPDLDYALLLLQALYHVPQVRSSLAGVHSIQDSPESNEEIEILCRCVELFVNLDLAIISKMDPAELCGALNPILSSNASGVAESTRTAYERLAQVFEKAVSLTSEHRLFTFTSAEVETYPGAEPKTETSQLSENTYVALDISASEPREPHDLLTRLARDLSRALPNPPDGITDGGLIHNVISDTSEVVVFVLTSSGSDASSSNPIPYTSNPTTFSVPLHSTNDVTSTASPFVYPPQIHIDTFLLSNFPLVHSKRLEWERLGRGMRESETARTKLLGRQYLSQPTTTTSGSNQTSTVPLSGYEAPRYSEYDYLYDDTAGPQDQGVLPSLRAALYYYEHIANRGAVGDPDGEARRRAVEETEKSLKATVEGLEKVLRDLNSTISSTKAQMKALFDGEELKKHRYDLRAVLMQANSPSSSKPSLSQLSQPGAAQPRPMAKQAPLFAYVRDLRDSDSESRMETQTSSDSTKKRPRWWKISPSGQRDAVQEVSEEAVFSFSTSPSTEVTSYTPYMLIYSKSLEGSPSSTTDVEWPPEYVASVRLNNDKYQEMVEALRMEKEQSAATSHIQDVKAQRLGEDVSMMDVTAGSQQ